MGNEIGFQGKAGTLVRSGNLPLNSVEFLSDHGSSYVGDAAADVRRRISSEGFGATHPPPYVAGYVLI